MDANSHHGQQRRGSQSRQAGPPGSLTAYLGPGGKPWGWCSCSAKRDVKNRRYLGHGAAESDEDRRLNWPLAQQPQRAAGSSPGPQPLNPSRLQGPHCPDGDPPPGVCKDPGGDVAYEDVGTQPYSTELGSWKAWRAWSVLPGQPMVPSPSQVRGCQPALGTHCNVTGHCST